MRTRAKLLGLLVLLIVTDLGGSASADLPPSVADFHKAPPLRVQPRRDLFFGDVLPGVATTILYTDINAAYYDIKGKKNSEVSINFIVLPPALDDGTSFMPVSFGPTAGGWSQGTSVATATPFDPNSSLLIRLSHNGKARIWLGGTADPLPTQAPGFYQANITLEVIETGN